MVAQSRGAQLSSWKWEELPGAADYLLMGFPDIVKFDTRFYEDADGNVYVEMQKLGVTLLAESPPKAGS